MSWYKVGVFNGSSSALISDNKDGGVNEINNLARFGEDDVDVFEVHRSDGELVGNRRGDKSKCRCCAVALWVLLQRKIWMMNSSAR